MADFNTHVVVAAAASGLATTLLVISGIASPGIVVTCFILGVAGGLLPDIDSPTSVPIRIAFALVSVIAGFAIVFTFGHQYSLLELVLLWIGSFVLIRGLFGLINRCSVHRGLIHSIPAGVIFGLVTTVFMFYGLKLSAVEAWLCGLFVIMGFWVHLLLDELYSVNLYGKKLRFKRSFGTAFKAGKLNRPYSTVALYLMVIGLLVLSPSPKPLADTVFNGDVYRQIQQRLVPYQMSGL